LSTRLGEPDVTVVIPTRRRPALLARCLEHLLDQSTDRQYEVIVVNDGVEPLLVPRDRRVRVIDTGGDAGPSSARNLGVAAARAPVIAFTDDDTEPDGRWIEAVAIAAERHPDAVGFEGPVLTGEYDVLYFHAPQPTPGTCCGANVAYRRALLLELGGFDERFRGWMPEDIEFGTRARRHGSVEYVDDMVVRHPPRPVGVRERAYQASMVYGTWLLFRKHPSLSRWRLPLRWGPAVAELRRWVRLLGRPDVVAGSPARVVRIVVLAACTTASATVACWRDWPDGGR
jgi:GT2 family glycosyltransferase